ncbi:ribbon-helix-helix domain-containing protein [Lunatibacter salilacus]|uniref:ribbon-helix-helix domain-containing protein n=1 Tax=Lunatibacter salilacus TaxID=2483804 RepID=UPI001F3878DD|nr:ribbon-helix-helix domain-containing protein [Lunatibacter salilacus]
MIQETQENRTHKITFRLNDREVKFLDEFSQSTGISRSDTLRKLIRKIQGDVTIIKTDKLLKTLNILAAEQGRVNNNINQLAKHANQYSNVADLDPKVFAQFNSLLVRHLDYQEEINRTFRKIYKTISQ